MIQLVLGGSGSGKSAFAEELVLKTGAGCKFYIATMKVYGEEEQKKILRHQILRKNKGFYTVEQPVDVNFACKKISENQMLKSENEKEDFPKTAVLLECVSNLTANEMFRTDSAEADKECAERDAGTEIEIREAAVSEKIINDIRQLSENCDELIIVTNNVFEDGINYDSVTKAYMKALGKINCELSMLADKVYEITVGIPRELK